MPFAEMLDPKTSRTRVRMVNVDSESYQVARRYMLRLRREDFEDAAQLENLAKAAGISADAFKARFEYLVKDEAR